MPCISFHYLSIRIHPQILPLFIIPRQTNRTPLGLFLGTSWGAAFGESFDTTSTLISVLSVKEPRTLLRVTTRLKTVLQVGYLIIQSLTVFSSLHSLLLVTQCVGDKALVFCISSHSLWSSSGWWWDLLRACCMIWKYQEPGWQRGLWNGRLTNPHSFWTLAVSARVADLVFSLYLFPLRWFSGGVARHSGSHH